MERWNNKIAVVTGASAGIGAAICKALLEQGMIVVGLARRLEKMETSVKSSIAEEYQSNFHCYKCDVSIEENVKDAFAWIIDTFGGVDMLINNAGIWKPTDITAEDNTAIMRDTVNTNILGVVWCTREAFQSMQRRNFNGHIVNIGSVFSHILPMSPGVNFNIYTPTKHAIKAMTEALRQEFWAKNTKVKISCLSPGLVRTEIMGDIELPVNVATLNAEDIADAVVYCLQTPPHVQIHDMIIRPMGDQL